MFNSSVLDVAIGVVMSFLALSLITSVLVEGLNSLLKLRSRTLRSGVMALMNDPGFTDLAAKLYAHAAVNPRGLGKTLPNTNANPKRNSPAYIDKMQFAAALLDVTGLTAASAAAAAQAPGPAAVSSLLAALTASSSVANNSQINDLLQGIIQRSQGDIKRVRQEVADWFDNAMDRVGGAFKRWTQLASVLIALTFACVLNLNALSVGHEIWEHPTLVEQLKVPASMQQAIQAPSVGTTDPTTLDARERSALETIKFLDASLPIGWQQNHAFEVCRSDGVCQLWWKSDAWLSLPLGWLLTAVATLFGAPFWFDILQGAIRLKGSGPSPAEKLDGSAASS